MIRPKREHGSHNSSDSRPKSHAFAAFNIDSSRRYDAWYVTPAGREMVDAEEAQLASCLAWFPGAASVLEVGCGTGHFSRWLSSRGLQVVGLDPSPAMLEVAREKDRGPTYIDGSAEHLPFPDSGLDLVAFITSLEFMSDTAIALKEASRVARLGLLLGVLNLVSPLGLSRKVGAVFHSSPYRAAHLYTPWELERRVRLALGDQLDSIEWSTTLWPGWAPSWARPLPFGAFIGAAVAIRPRPNSAPTQGQCLGG